MSELINLQLTMFSMMFLGLLFRKLGIIKEEGKKNITDLVIYLVLPCNVFKSFMVEFSKDTLVSFGTILIISILIQIGCVLLGKILYDKKELRKRQCLQYGIICSNAGFLGNPVAEGVFGSMGLTLASVYLIPQRIMMWSSGLAVFSGSTDKKAVVKKVVTHPCILACILGLVWMLTQFPLPAFLVSTIQYVGNCNTALSMMVIGMILAQIDTSSLFDKDVVIYTAIRLIVIPVLVYILLRILHVDHLVMGVSVLLAAMPAGATTSILASKYEADADFATKMVVFSTLISLFTSAVWSFVLA